MKNTIKILGVSALALLLFGFRKKTESNNVATGSLEDLAIKATKNAFGNLSSTQIDSIIEITKAFNVYGDGDGSKLAYILATAWHESSLKPIKEVRAAQGTSLYTTQNAYWETGYYGRGFVQLTHLTNYQRMSNFLGIDLVNNPDLALQTNNAAKIIVYGMFNGSFTGKKLSDYISTEYSDFFNARRIVNGLDRAQLINQYAQNIVNYNNNVV